MYLSSFINKTEVLIWQIMWLYFLQLLFLNCASCLSTCSYCFFKRCPGIRYGRVKVHAIFVSTCSTITRKIIPVYFQFFLLDNPILQQIDGSTSPYHFSIKFKRLLQFQGEEMVFFWKGWHSKFNSLNRVTYETCR